MKYVEHEVPDMIPQKMYKFLGESPSSFCLFASCDPKYLYEHAKAYVTSCAINQNDTHLHIINASEDDWFYAQTLRIGYNIIYPKGKMTISSEILEYKLSPEQWRTYYACNRFLIASEIVSDNVLITDIDCLIMSHIKPFDTHLGLFLRDPLPGVDDWESQGTKVAAGAVYCSKEALQYLKLVSEVIRNNELKWFLDQAALSVIYEQIKDQVTLTKIDSNFMDWEFIPGTKIWTGKGPRKYDNPTYVGMKKTFNLKFPNLREAYWK